jgi:hypothetical protein
MKAKNFLRYLAVFLLFSGCYAAVFYLYKVDLQLEFLQSADEVPSIRSFGSNAVSQMQEVALSWGALAGIGIGLLAFVGSLILLGIVKAAKLSGRAWAHVVALVLAYGLWLAFAIELLYFENRFSAIAIGIIVFVGRPLYVAAISALLAAAAFYLLPSLIRLIKREKSPAPTAALLLVALIFLPGCSLLAQIEELACLARPDSVHCYQEAAVASGDDDECAKVPQHPDYKSAGSNPPQDKCYMMVAQNTGDLSACDKMKGGVGSYTKEECILSASIENNNAQGCQKLSGAAKEECVSKVGPYITPSQVLEVDKQIKLLEGELAKGGDAELQKQLEGLKSMRGDMLDTMLEINRKTYEKQSDPINQDIIGDWATGQINDKTKTDLIELNDRLRDQGVPLTKEQYDQLKKVLQRRNDPEYDIEQMDPKDILKKGIGESAGEFVDKLKFWRVGDTVKEKKLDQQLRFYQKMLERQKAIDKGLSKADQEFWDVTNKIFGAAQDKITDEIKSKIIEETFGDLLESSASGPTSAILGEAIDEVKRNAKSAEFRGMVNIYNVAMEEELAAHGGDVDKAHAAVVKNLTDNPDRYSYEHTFAQPTNLIKNKDCDGSNPEHCLNKEVFWKAMKKSYKYQNPGK